MHQVRSHLIHNLNFMDSLGLPQIKQSSNIIFMILLFICGDICNYFVIYVMESE